MIYLSLKNRYVTQFYCQGKGMDYLRIEGLQVKTHIGVHPWEQKILQLLLIDIEIPRDFSQTNDQLQATIDYDAVCQHIIQTVSSQSFNLIETVAYQILSDLKMHFHVSVVKVSVSKPHAVAQAKNISVEVSTGY